MYAAVRARESRRGGIERQLIFNPIFRFLFRLANEHRKSVSQILKEYPSWELTAWAIFFKLQAEELDNKRQGKTVLRAEDPEQEYENLRAVLGGTDG